MISQEELNKIEANADGRDVPRLVSELRRVVELVEAASRFQEAEHEYKRLYAAYGESISQLEEERRKFTEALTNLMSAPEERVKTPKSGKRIRKTHSDE